MQTFRVEVDVFSDTNLRTSSFLIYLSTTPLATHWNTNINSTSLLCLHREKMIIMQYLHSALKSYIGYRGAGS